jgi:hypothetical protein
MDLPRLSKAVRRVTVFEHDSSGQLHPVTLYTRRGSKKRQTSGVKPAERMARAAADAGEAFFGTYRTRHRQSNRKRKDGWLRDTAVNLAKAGDRARKKLDPIRVLGS